MSRRRRAWILSLLVLCILLGCGSAWAQENKHALTMEDVIRLSKKGESLTAADFEGYEGTVYGMHQNSVRYEIGEDYRLEIDASPFMTRLFYRKIDRCGIDIRYFDVEEFVNCGDKSKYILYNRRMTEADFLRLYKLGDGLRYDHFMHFDDGYGGYLEYGTDNSVNFWSEYTPIKGYILHMGDDDLEGAPLRVWLMKENAPEYCMDIREGNLGEFIEGGKNLPEKPRMTMADVKALAQKGMALSWDDLRRYKGKYEIDYSINADYSIEGGIYRLEVRGEDWDEVPTSVQLITIEDEEMLYPFIDIRWESVEEFIRAEDKRIYKPYGQRISREEVCSMAAQDYTFCLKSDRYCPDNMFFMSNDEGELKILRQYVLDDTFSLLVCVDVSGRISYVRLMLNAEPKVYMDIREGDVGAFFAQYDSTENRHTGQMTWECVYSVYEEGMLLSSDLWDVGDAKNIGMGENFSLYRYAVEDSHSLILVLPNDVEKGYRPKAYLISNKNEDDFVNLWAKDEDVSERLRELEQAQENKPTLTMEDVIRLSKKGESLTAADFEGYEGTAFQTYSEFVCYEIDDDYQLKVDTGSGLMIRLFYRKIDQCGIDIRYFDVEEFVNCEDKSKYIIYHRKMTEKDLLKLCELGGELRYEHFMHFAHGSGWREYGVEGEVNFWSEYKPIEGYILHIGVDDFEGVPIRAWLMKETVPEYCMDIREGNVPEFIEGGKNLPEKPRMTMADVKALAQKGMALSWDDLRQYAGDYEIYDLVNATYSIDEGYYLEATGMDWNSVPDQVYLRPNDADEYLYIDIRWENVEEFISAEDKSKYKLFCQRISRDDVRAFAAQGENVFFDSNRYQVDNMFYISDEDSQESVVYQYVVDDTFSILVDLSALRTKRSFMRLMLNADPEVYIDIGKGDVDAFFEQYDSAENQHTGRLTIQDVRLMCRLRKLMQSEGFENYGAKNIAVGELYSVYRYEIGNSYIVMVTISNQERNVRNMYLISKEDEDNFEDILWRSNEEISNRLWELEQELLSDVKITNGGVNNEESK